MSEGYVRIMTSIHPDLVHKFRSWPDRAAECAHSVRSIFVQTAKDIGVNSLEESLKWGEPAWRPKKGGITLRVAWSTNAPEELGVFVDCKSDLCARMQSDFPRSFRYIAPRVMYIALDETIPEDALTHLAKLAFQYKRLLPRD